MIIAITSFAVWTLCFNISGGRAVRSVRFNDTLAGAIDAEAVQARGDAYIALLHDLDELVNTDTAFQARLSSPRSRLGSGLLPVDSSHRR